MTLPPVKKITPPAWAQAPALIRIFEILEDVLCVGGAVRNSIIGMESGDVDLATPFAPEAVMQRLSDAGFKVIPTGIEHGTITAVMDKTAYEITTLRRDVETDGRRAVVAYTDSWVDDARRRDFTMNTLLMDLSGNIFDPTGQGLKDLEAGIVRFVGAPEQRIAEDFLRILRYFRFHAAFGKGGYDVAALKACAGGAGNIKTLSRERITQEFFKIIASDKPHEVLAVMFEHGILREFAFTEYDPILLRDVAMFQARYGLIALSSRLFILAGMRMENIRAMSGLILFPKVFLKDMEAILGALSLSDLSCDAAVRAAIYRFGRSMVAQTLMIELAQDRVMTHYAPQALKIIQTWDIPNFPINGHDVMQAGISQGKDLGKILHTIEEWWIAEDFKPDRADCLSKI